MPIADSTEAVPASPGVIPWTAKTATNAATAKHSSEPATV